VEGPGRIDADAAAQAYEALKPMDAMLRGPSLFKPAVEPPAGADNADCIAAVWGAQTDHYWSCPADARALVSRRLSGDWS
jgi:hypothetical protein